MAAIIVTADGVWGITRWFISWAALGVLPPVTYRFVGLLGQANQTACVINMLWPVVVARLIESRRLLGRLALGALTVGLASVSFFTSSRAGWLSAGLSVVLLVTLLAYSPMSQDLRRNLRGRWQRTSGAGRLIAFVGVGLAGLAGAWLLLKESQHITHGSVLDARQQFWSAAWDLFRTRPLTGLGPDLFAWFYPRYASIPPEFFAPHAHSVIFQILSGSGLMGASALLILGGAIAVRLWKLWTAGGRQAETACLIVALVSFGVHGLFDFPVTPNTLFLLVVLLALALTPTPLLTSPRTSHPVVVAPFLLLPIGVFAFLLYGSDGNNRGLRLADANQWLAAARVFEQTAQADPRLTIYWEEAAYAYTLAGDVPQALPLWDRAARDDPNWALLPGTIGALRQDLTAAQAARALAPGSYLLALNAGAVAEGQGNSAAAQEAYDAALNLKPTIAGTLYWQQNSLRQNILRDWQSRLAVDGSTLATGWAALTADAPDQAIVAFQAAKAQDPNSLAPYLGLGRAYLAQHDLVSAQRAAQAGLLLPVTAVEDTLPMHLLAGDVSEARGDRAGALAEYSLVFGAIADYGIDGPGSYRGTERSWYVFHREALPGELVPQLPRADITPEMDQRFAQLAQWLQDAGQHDTACYVLTRVNREAPISTSGQLHGQLCGAP